MCAESAEWYDFASRLFGVSPLHTSRVLLQVPQYVLDAAIRDGRGAECSIVCTQPRRISAVGVAGRVAQVLMLTFQSFPKLFRSWARIGTLSCCCYPRELLLATRFAML